MCSARSRAWRVAYLARAAEQGRAGRPLSALLVYVVGYGTLLRALYFA
jgi:hypothetical protein